MSRKSWNDQAYTDIVAKYPALDAKPESVAFCAWCYDADPEMGGEEIKDRGKETGLSIAGRAMGSAREILGLRPRTKTPGSKAAGRSSSDGGARRGRRAGAGNAAPSSLRDLSKAVEEMHRDHAQLKGALIEIRQIIARAL